MISEFIQIVTIALIGFTALSLVVSSFMIAIITYVSVVERVKEIVRREMTGALDFGVPLEVGIGVGSNWLDAH